MTENKPAAEMPPAAPAPRAPAFVFVFITVLLDMLALSLANALYGLLVLPVERRAGFAWRRANPFGALVLLGSRPQLSGLATVNFLGNLAHASLPSISVLYMQFRYGWDERTVGFTMAGVGLCAMIVQGGLIGRTVQRFGERTTLIVGLGFGVAGFAVFGLAPTGLIFWSGIPLLALWGFASPSALGLMSRRERQRTGPIAGRQ